MTAGRPVGIALWASAVAAKARSLRRSGVSADLAFEQACSWARGDELPVAVEPEPSIPARPHGVKTGLTRRIVVLLRADHRPYTVVELCSAFGTGVKSTHKALIRAEQRGEVTRAGVLPATRPDGGGGRAVLWIAT